MAYTDGSAIPNPGPCGAGFVLKLQGQLTYSSFSQHLGVGDNNKGEMGASHGALVAVNAAIDDGAVTLDSIVLCFSDSAICIAYLDKGWAFARWTVVAHATRALLRRIRKRVKVVLYWIRGHAGIPGNEEADTAAKLGAAPSPTGDADSTFTRGRSGFYLEGQGPPSTDPDPPPAERHEGQAAPDRSMGPPLPRLPRAPAVQRPLDTTATAPEDDTNQTEVAVTGGGAGYAYFPPNRPQPPTTKQNGQRPHIPAPPRGAALRYATPPPQFLAATDEDALSTPTEVTTKAAHPPPPLYADRPATGAPRRHNLAAPSPTTAVNRSPPTDPTDHRLRWSAASDRTAKGDTRPP